VNDENSASSFAAPHHFRFWRWVAFDPPMRDSGSRGCRKRAVMCQQCSSDLGSVEDPVDGFLMAWRHRRKMRRGTDS